MTNAQKVFCDEYLKHLNATEAYKVAYPKEKAEETINASASRLLRNVKVAKYIEERMKEREEETKVTQNMVIQELAKIAFSDIRELYTDTGALKNIKSLENKIAGAISSLETFEEFEGRGDDREYIGDTKKVKMLDKTKALELLGKHLGMFKETNVNINTNYEEYLRRVEGDEY